MVCTALTLRSARRGASSVARVRALAGEYFGGIWFKIFSERGPSRLAS